MATKDLIKLNQDIKNAIEMAKIKRLNTKPFDGLIGQEIRTIKGVPGDKGERGDKGDKGDKGEKGDKGDKGDRGDKGEFGPVGVDGLNGKDGRDGIDGKDGKDGTNGLDGTLLTGEQIKIRLENLSGEERLDASAIKNLPQPSFGGRGGGGISELIAGTGITLQRNGPRYTINSTATAVGTGDVVGPAGAVAGNVVTFDGATGKLIQDSGLTLSGTNTGDQVGDGVTITGTGTILDPFVAVAGAGGITRSVQSVAINTNAGANATTDYVYICTGTIDVTLPTAVGNTNLYTIKNIGVNTVTVKPTGAETLDGEATQPILNQYDSISFISNNSNWLIV